MVSYARGTARCASKRSHQAAPPSERAVPGGAGAEDFAAAFLTVTRWPDILRTDRQDGLQKSRESHRTKLLEPPLGGS